MAGSETEWFASTDARGIGISHDRAGDLCASADVDGLFTQLVDDGFATPDGSGYRIQWAAFFRALTSGHYKNLAEALALPRVSTMQPVLESTGSLSDASFAIAIRGWKQPGRREVHPVREGGIFVSGTDKELLTADQWDLCAAIDAFAACPGDARKRRANQLAWANIRELAGRADAALDDFLTRSVVLSPETLQLHLRRARLQDDESVVEIEPGFDGAPQGWLDLFDKWAVVRDEYDLHTPEGVVQILVRREVQAVLREIKRMPGRRVAGARAEAFIKNPYAVLPPEAQDVIDEGQFTAARDEAGIRSETFSPVVERDSDNRTEKVGLLIESIASQGVWRSVREWMTPDELDAFVDKLQRAIDTGHVLLAWRGYDLELQANSIEHLELLQGALREWRNVKWFVAWDDVFDLGRYSPRVDGIGEAPAFYSPYIVRKKPGEWLPENVAFAIGYVPPDESDRVVVTLTPAELEELRKRVDVASGTSKKEAVELPGFPKPIPLPEAKRILDAFKNLGPDLEKGQVQADDSEHANPVPTKPRVERKTLLLLSNLQQVDYEERRKHLADVPNSPRAPGRLRRHVKLLDHQKFGLAWLQHLYASRRTHGVSGAVLADDMGLGKTLQLLAFMSSLVERDPLINPMLVVAPVALLQNWKEELEKFFERDTLPLLVAYGADLDALLLPREAVDERLREDAGLVNFMRPGWVGSAKLVLTTYETLRNLEFSFAPQAWSVMVCDEAQRIKNPAAMVTRAAKKQKAAFKIACTGTPVENTLVDLWCLFDFVQPGLLGALDEFGKRYRKPIEARTDEERGRVEELRQLVTPQLLRRTKAEVARDLPRKIVSDRCRQLEISPVQRQLYAKAVHDFKRRDEAGAHVPISNHLSLLQYLRLLCTDPRRYGSVPVLGRPLSDYRSDAPKMDWLIARLGAIRDRGEKVIVFCEFRDIQRLLKHYIHDALGIDVDIINGDTTPDPKRSDSRQRRIGAFQSRPGFGVIILSPVAVGFGLNIQAANHVVHYTRTWNPAKEDQATDRAYRIGQTRDVYVYYPVVTANDFTTFDARLDQLLDEKRRLATDILNGAGDVGPGDFSGVDVSPPGMGGGVDPLVDLDAVRSLDGRRFEGLVGALWAKRVGGTVFCTPASGDKGVDVVVIEGGTGILIQTKVTSLDHGSGLGWDAVKEVTGGEAYYQQLYPNVGFEKMCVTNRHFNSDAQKLAKINLVTLIEGRELGKLLKKYAIHDSDIDTMLYASPYA